MTKFSKLLAQSLIWRSIYFITVFAVNLVLSRYFGAAKSGVIFYISNTFAFVQLIAGVSFENGITFFGASKKIETNQLLWLCLLWAAVIIIFEIIFFYFFVPNSLVSNGKVSQYAFCFITGYLLISYSSNLFYAKGNFFFPNSILSFFNVAFLIFIFVAGFGKQTNSDSIIDAYFFVFLSQGVVITIAFLLLHKSWQLFSLPRVYHIKSFLKYSLTVLLFNVLLFLVYRIDYYFVRYSPVCSAADLGNYIQASKLGQMLLVIPQIIGSAVYPQVSSGTDIKAVSRAILLLIKLLAFLFIVIFIIVFFLGDWLFPFLFGDTFHKVQTPLLLLLPGIYGLAIISFISNFFSGKGNVFISVRAAAVAFIIVVGGDVLFVNKYGINAAALISSIGYFTMFCLYLLPFKKEANILFWDFFRLHKNDFSLLKQFLSRSTDIYE